MLRTIPRVLVAMGVVATAATTAACGGADKTEACTNIQNEIQRLFQTAAQQIDDPQALADSLRGSATKIREEGEPVGGAVEQAASEAATALNRLADRVAEGSTQQSDLEPLPEAANNIREACA